MGPPAAASVAEADDDDPVDISASSTVDPLPAIAADEPTDEKASGGQGFDSLITDEVSRLEAALHRTPAREEPADTADESGPAQLDIAEAQPETEAETETADVAETEDANGADRPASGGKHRMADDDPAGADSERDKATGSSGSDGDDSGDSQD